MDMTTDIKALMQGIGLAAREASAALATAPSAQKDAALVAAAGEGDHWLALPTHAVRGREQPIDILHWQGEQET